MIQQNRCAICKVKQEELDYDLVLDHDHVTGRIRGLLCHKCNTGIGLLQDDPDILQNAIDYLNETPFDRIEFEREHREESEDDCGDIW